MELSRLAELAKEDPDQKFFSIAHLLTSQVLYEAFLSLRKDASAGVDRVTYADYEKQALQNIKELHERLKCKTYRVQPLRRVYIPKEEIASYFSGDPVVRDGARIALANASLSVASDDSRDVEVLKEAGLQALARNYKSLPIDHPSNK